ncbi:MULTISPECIES: hypothetical protein [Kribbella]|uniref:Uncharacterized protein n=1 Tax=Kribbella karoonensis TaxID=324851 RepID=A0ABP4PW51_9ACTN
MSIAIDVSAGNSRTIVKGIVGLGVAAAVCLVLGVLASGSVRASRSWCWRWSCCSWAASRR